MLWKTTFLWALLCVPLSARAIAATAASERPRAVKRRRPAPPPAPVVSPVAPPKEAVAPPPRELSAPSIALAGVRAGAGVPAEVVSMLDQAFDAELRALDGVSVVSSADVVVVLGVERQKQLLGAVPGVSVAGLLTGIEASDIVALEVALSQAGYRVDARRLSHDGSLVKAQTLEVGADATELAHAPVPLVLGLFPELSHRSRGPVPPTVSARPIRVAVLDVRGTGEIPPRAFAALNQSITPELRKLEGVSAIASAELADMLGVERQKQLLGCADAATSCLAELAGALDADEMVTIDLTLVGERYAMTARRTDLKRSKVVQTQLRQFEKRDGEELLAVTGPSIAALYPERPLKAGRTRGVEAAQIRRLNPPPLPRWIFIATTSAGVAATAAGGAFTALRFDAENDFNTLAQRSVTEPVNGADLNALQAKAVANSTRANALFLAAGGLALVAAVEIFFTDWKDDRAAFSAQPLAFAGGGGLLVTFRQ